MFPLHSSLFTKSQGSQDVFPAQHDGASDYSQLQNAQFSQCEIFSENSQDYSQMFYSQNEDNSGSNSEGYRQAPVYEKYIAKPSLFGGRGRGKPASQNRSYKSHVQHVSNPMKLPGQLSQQNNFQQIASQKAKTRERDERDLLGSIVKMVKDCADEVKSSLTIFKETDDSKVDDIKSSVKILQSSFEQSSNRILKAVEGREDHLLKIRSLERDLQNRDEEIQLLKEQQKSYNNTEDSFSKLLDKMKSFVSDQQHQMEQKIQHVVETTQEQLTIIKDLNQNKKLGLEESNKNFQDMKYSNQRQLHDIEKRLIDEIVQVRDDFDRQKREMENFYRNQMQTFHQKQTRGLEQYIKQGIENVLHKSEFITVQDIKDSETEIVTKNESQHKQLENHLKLTTKQQSELLLKQCEDSLKKHQTVLEKRLMDNFDSLRSQQSDFIQQSSTTLTKIHNASKMAWENDNVPKHVQDQLNTLHSKHQSEIKRFEAVIKKQKKREEEGVGIKRNVSYGGLNTCNVYDLNKTRLNVNQSGPLFKKSIGFLSPKPLQGTRWDSRTLFGCTNPSPVATVLPQRKPIMGKVVPSQNTVTELSNEQLTSRCLPALNESMLQLSQSENNQSVDEEDQEAAIQTIQTTTRKKASRKRKQFGSRKRRVKKGNQANKSNINGTSVDVKGGDSVVDCCAETETDKISQVERSSKVKTIEQSKRNTLGLYDFCDDEPAQPNRKNVKLSEQIVHSQHSETTSKTFSDESAESSPSLSVTEVFISRRVHNGSKDTRGIIGVSGAGSNSNSGVGIFSSPNMLEMLKQNTGDHKILTQHGQVQVPRMKEKRKLCDFDSHHTQVFQMIHCLQKKTY